MRYFDVFNGDADGICALHQLRLADPLDSTLVTGLKHDLSLLKRVPAQAGDVVTVLDISLDRNRDALLEILGRGASVCYFDHHYAGAIPVHRDLRVILDPEGSLCTSALVDRHLGGRHRPWAVVGAFGDGLEEAAMRLAGLLGLESAAIERLRELGVALNYNAYGATEADVAIAPIALYRLVRNYADPFDLCEREPIIARLSSQRREDLALALALAPTRASARADAYVLPDAPWSRRVSGTFANHLASSRPHKACAVITPLGAEAFGVSVRSPLGHAPLAVDFCRAFPTGGGRARAAGIERLDRHRLAAFLDAFDRAWRAPATGATLPPEAEVAEARGSGALRPAD